MRSNREILFWLLTLTAIFISIFIGHFKFLTLSTGNISSVFATLGNFFILALFIERSVQVIRSLYRMTES